MPKQTSDDLGIPDFLKRTGKPAAKEEVKAAEEVTLAPVIPSKEKTKKAKATNATNETKEGFGFKTGSVRDVAAGMYAASSGATVEEVKSVTGSIQLNLLKELEAKGWTVKRVKEEGSGKRKTTRYYLSK